MCLVSRANRVQNRVSENGVNRANTYKYNINMLQVQHVNTSLSVTSKLHELPKSLKGNPEPSTICKLTPA